MCTIEGSTSNQDPRHLVDGVLVAGDGMDLTPTNPATGEALPNVRLASPTQLESAMAAAHDAQRAWAASSDRGAILAAIGKTITANRELLAHTLSLETGVPISQTQVEVDLSALFFRHRSALRASDSVIRSDDREHVQTFYQPIGVVAAIIPWNAPLMIASEKIGSALAMGNTVVLKSSTLAPLTVALFARLVSSVAPHGVINILTGDDDLGRAMVSHELTGMVSFTGSTATGQSIMASAALGMTRLSLELGGNDPAIVLPGVDPTKTARRIVMSSFYRSGQVCAAIKRVYVPTSMADQFLQGAIDAAESLRIGDPFDESTTLGPLSNQQQFDRVVQLVDQARNHGGDILAGGLPTAGPGFGYAATIVANAPADTPLVAQEQFGPALPIQTYDDIDGAVAAANEGRLGLGASVWTPDTEEGTRVARGIQSGSVWINRHGIVLPDIPFGGMKESGYGRTNGDAVISQYGEMQTVSVALPR